MACSRFVKSESKHLKKEDNLSPIEKNKIIGIKDLLKELENDLQDSLEVYCRAFDTIFLQNNEYLYQKCLEFFIESLINKAKDNLLKNEFNIFNFTCRFCGDIIRDPVTLNCGHTFSKKCAVLSSRTSSFKCVVCFKGHSHSYLLQLKNDVFVSKIIQKVWKNCAFSYKNRCDLYTHLLGIINIKCGSDLQTCISFIENPSPKNFLLKGHLLVSLGRYNEAIYLFLVFSVLVPDASYIKSEITKYLFKLLCFYPVNTKNFEYGNSYTLDPWGLPLLIKKFCDTIKELTEMKFLTTNSLFQIQDFECSLCLQTFLEPITTSCGHTFCQRCLLRWFDHKPSCPLCKSPLTSYIAECEKSTSKFALRLIKTIFPDIYKDRETLYLKELSEFFYPNKRQVLPLFICTLTFPSVACPLHVYEPRYKLMVRQCLEAGRSRFGMCSFINNEISKYGTVLEIKDVSYFPDGRSVVYTIGVGRFCVLSKGEHNGYPFAVVEYLKDEVTSNSEKFKKVHDCVYKTAARWFAQLSHETKLKVLKHFGPMPPLDINLFSSADGPSWFWWIIAILPLDQELKVKILAMVSLNKRLRALEKILLCI